MPISRRTAILIASVRSALPLSMWCLFAVWMFSDWRRDPFDPALTGTRAYGHNVEGALQWGLTFSLLELVVFYAAACPFLVRRPRLFFLLPLLSTVPLAGWFVVCAVLSMHGGGITMIHLIWLLALGVALLMEAGTSAITGRLSVETERGA